MIPCNIGVSIRSGELELITVKIDGSRSRVASSTPRAMRDHLDAIDVLLAAEAVAVDVLVGEGQHVERGEEVSHRCMDVDGLDGVAPDEVDRVEHVGELEKIVEPDPVPGTTDAVEADDVRRTADGAVGHPVATDVEVLLGVPTVQGELGRGRGDPFEDHLLGKSNVLPGLVDVGAGIAQEAP